MKSYVYLLINHDKTCYKIGKTDNINLRIKTLSHFWGEFQVFDSFAIECNADYAFKLESLLKNLVHDYKVEFEEEFKEKNGWSEFFKIESLDSLKEFIESSLIVFKSDLKLIYIKDLKQN